MYLDYKDLAIEGMRSKLMNAFKEMDQNVLTGREAVTDAIMELIMVMVQVEVDDLRDRIEKRGMYDPEY